MAVQMIKIDFFSKFVQKMKLGSQTLICAKVSKIEFEKKIVIFVKSQGTLYTKLKNAASVHYLQQLWRGKYLL